MSGGNALLEDTNTSSFHNCSPLVSFQVLLCEPLRPLRLCGESDLTDKVTAEAQRTQRLAEKIFFSHGHLLSQLHYRCTSTALIGRGGQEAGDVRMAVEEAGDRATQGAGAVAMDDSHLAQTRK